VSKGSTLSIEGKLLVEYTDSASCDQVQVIDHEMVMTATVNIAYVYY